MAILDDINSQRDAALAILDQKIVAANDLKNNGAAGMDRVIDALAQQRADTAAQAYAAGLDDPTMTAALAALKAATSEMNTVAAVMVSAASFLSNVTKLITAAGKVTATLKGS